MADDKLSALAALAVEMANSDEIYLNDSGVSKRQLYSVFKAAFALAGHTILSHDTDTTGAELTALGDGSVIGLLHRHAKLVAPDGSPDPAVEVNNAGLVGIGVGASTITEQLQVGDLLTANDGGTTKIRLVNGASSVGAQNLLVSGNVDANDPYFAIEVRVNSGSIVEAIRIKESDVLVQAANLVIGTAGKGIDMNGGPKVLFGTGTPEAAVTAAIGSTFMRSDGGAGTSFYVKESGAGNTGWVGK